MPRTPSALALLALAACGRGKPDTPQESARVDDSSAHGESAPPDSRPQDSEPQDSQPELPLPGGRAYYVLSMFGGESTTSRWSILRTLELSPEDETHGAVLSESWAWYQSRFTGDASTNKVPTGFTTAGGPYTGVVRTPLGFEPGSPGTTLRGSYTLEGEARLSITWESGKQDSWAISEPLDYPVSMLTLESSDYAALHAWGFGSTTPISGEGASVEQLRAAGDLSFQDLWGNAYDAADYQNRTYFSMSRYLGCSEQAMMIEEPQDLACDRWHSYVAGDPALVGRRSYWNHQLGEVGCYEADHACPDASCEQWTIGEGGGHTLAMLQVLDDDGVFRGWVAAEASLHGRYTGGALVGASYWMQP
ncbi:MAG: hypothetical protein H6741_17920 [Alphaproteobacteria bacterium]|nr:hypothetical protein [Alphaproteobacteria bacterium]